MKYYLSLVALFGSLFLVAQSQKNHRSDNSPLATYSREWNNAIFAKCNTADKTSYLTRDEKDVIYILNLVRSYPQLFANTVLKNYPDSSDQEDLAADSIYYQSLMQTLLEMKPAGLLYPDLKCYTSAQCHAFQSGITGYEGHDRTNKDCRKKEFYSGECIDYGNADPLNIVLSLLIDQGVPSLGHRLICLGDYGKLGVSIEPHKSWDYNAVLDFQE